MSYGGVNSGVVLHDDMVVAIHGKENVDSSVIGRMVGIRKPSKLPSLDEDIMILGSEHEVWRNNGMEAFTSSPVYRQSRIYVTIKRGELVCLDASTGEEHWVLKLAPDQVHASPAWADGKLSFPLSTESFLLSEMKGIGERSLAKWIWAPLVWPPHPWLMEGFSYKPRKSFLLWFRSGCSGFCGTTSIARKR